MLPYVLVLCWVVLVSSSYGARCGRVSNLRESGLPGSVIFLGLVASVPLVLLLAFRKEVGTDYEAYLGIYNAFRDGCGPAKQVEPLYAILNISATPLGDWGLVLVFGVAAALAITPIIWRILKSSDMPWLSIIVLFGMAYPFLATNGVRFVVAVAVMFFLFPAIWNRKPAIWIAGGIFSAGFHYTALLILPFYWILRRDWSVITAVILFIMAILMSTQKTVALSFLKWVPYVLPSTYAHYPVLVLEHLENYGFGFGYIWYLLSSLFVLVLWRRVGQLGVAETVIRNAFFLGVVIMIGAYQFWAVGRFGWYFGIAGTLYWPLAACRLFGRERSLLLGPVLMIHVTLFVHALLFNAHDAVPYQSVFG